MALGPIEVLVVGFPGNQFNGEIIPELEKLVEAGTISVIDGIFIRKDVDGSTTFVEFSELGDDEDANRLVGLLNQIDSLISDEDVQELTESLEPNSSAAMLVFEHTWAKPFRDAIVGSGGQLAADIRIPGAVVEDLMAELSELSN
jgi:hypothetical protein